MRKVLIFAVMVTLLFATSAMAFEDGTIEQRSFRIDPFCNVITIQWQVGGEIWGTEDNCGQPPGPSRVGGWFDSVQDWVMFLDWPGAPEFFEYGLIKGSGRNGTLYRWETNGTPAVPTAVFLVDPLSTEEGGAGPAGALGE